MKKYFHKWILERRDYPIGIYDFLDSSHDFSDWNYYEKSRRTIVIWPYGYLLKKDIPSGHYLAPWRLIDENTSEIIELKLHSLVENILNNFPHLSCENALGLIYGMFIFGLDYRSNKKFDQPSILLGPLIGKNEKSSIHPNLLSEVDASKIRELCKNACPLNYSFENLIEFWDTVGYKIAYDNPDIVGMLLEAFSFEFHFYIPQGKAIGINALNEVDIYRRIGKTYNQISLLSGQLPKLMEQHAEINKCAKFQNNTPQVNPLEIPPGTKWENITIEFTDNENVKIFIEGMTPKRVNYAEMGFKDNRKNGVPNSRWKVLQRMAKHGCITYEDRVTPEAKNAIKNLRKAFKIYFQLIDDPFHKYSSKNGYRPKFTLNRNPNDSE